ncbi:hypothetical protein [Thiomicrorhabdus aquaedulcis]|uniref:hypothetical protein n=1 Tax=Thiomicrorhabdus aquaedulcis TaxID=2211106 RepID=UPI000FD8F2AD|nr:hypothetical protein [Thiomicrorhabdus aquaedulcis]
MGFFKSIIKMVIVGLIFLTIRSPLAMLLIGLTGGMFFYHLYPNKAQEYIGMVSGGYDSFVEQFTATPVVNFLPENRGS